MKRQFLLFLFISFFFTLFADVKLPSIFTDHAVLQRNVPIRIWGWADKGEKVVVTLNKQKQIAIADNTGRWQLKLNAMPAGGPYDLTITGQNKIVLKDILLGEVWLCSGQSNMAFTLKDSQKASEEISMAHFPNIRQFKIKEKISAEPSEDIDASQWKVCSPDVAGDFSAVAYYFAKFIDTELNIPIGIINASFGGTYIEAWMSHSALIKNVDYKDVPELKNVQLEKWFLSIADLYSFYKQKLGIESYENYKVDDSKWNSAIYDDSKWLDVPFPGNFDKTILPCFDGSVWFRTIISIDNKAAKEGLRLHVGEIKDEYEIYINGVKINQEKSTDSTRHFDIDANQLNLGKNVIAIKIIDYWELGGFISPANDYFIEYKNGNKVLLAEQPWKMNISSVFRVWLKDPNVQPNVLFNGMINPITSYTIKGTLWYQGENNEDFAYQYRNLLPLLITDWRNHFKQGDFPFYFVQLPNYKKFNQNSQNGGANWAEMRESLYKSLKVPNTGMAVTIDLGDSMNIHPLNKEEVGKRLSLIALNNLYNKQIEYSGPEVELITKSKEKIIVTFKKSNLMIKDRYGFLRGFEIAGENQHFYFTPAILEGNNVILQNVLVPNPVSVRYSWSNNPDGNLYNNYGLPASPFRTDAWKLTTEGNRFDSWVGNRYKIEYTKP